LTYPTRYKIGGEYRDGYFARLRRAVDTTTGDEVAVKQLLPAKSKDHNYRQRFIREIRITGSLSDLDGVVRVLFDGSAESPPFYVMPWARSNVFDLIRGFGQGMEAEDRANICLSLVTTMAQAHAPERNVLHRDLAPWNVLVYGSDDEDRRIVIADFGLGKTADEFIQLTNSSAGGYGAALYAAPEQRERLRQATTRSDVYSLGRVIDFVMTGRDPDNPASHVLTPVSRRATQHDPDNRYGHAGAMLEALQRQYDLVFGRNTDRIASFADLEDLKPPFDWDQIHHQLVHGSYSGSAYYNYLDPVISFLLTKAGLQEYAEQTDDFDAFGIRLAAEIDQCTRQMGWPFDESRRLYSMLARCFPLCRTTEGKVACFRELWDGAFNHDRWSAQGDVHDLLRSHRLDLALQAEMAAAILESGGRYVKDQTLSSAPTGPLRNAIRTVMEVRK
jgi:eukaryotic-like serine/threonine-protein kinase